MFFDFIRESKAVLLSDFKDGFFLSPFIANWLIYKDIPKLFRKRIEVQRLRTASIWYLMALLRSFMINLKRKGKVPLKYNYR